MERRRHANRLRPTGRLVAGMLLLTASGCAAPPPPDLRPPYAAPDAAGGEPAVLASETSGLFVDEVDGARVKPPNPFFVVPTDPVPLAPGARRIAVTYWGRDGQRHWAFVFRFIAGRRYVLELRDWSLTSALKIRDTQTETSVSIY